jgi:hypothetical protein
MWNTFGYCSAGKVAVVKFSPKTSRSIKEGFELQIGFSWCFRRQNKRNNHIPASINAPVIANNDI